MSDEEIANEKDEIKRSGLVYNARWKRVADALSDLSVEGTEAEVVWGEPAKVAVGPLKQCANTMYVSLTSWVRYQQRGRTDDRYYPLIEKHEKIIYAGIDEDDEYGKELDTAVTGIESLAKPHLKI